MKSKPFFIIFLLIGAVGVGTLLFFKRERSNTEATVEKSVFIKSVGENIPEGSIVIHMTKNGFEPEEIEIKRGDTVTWVNDDSDFRWPASNLHPTHGIYPEFDPQEPIAQSEWWSFQFKKEGVWKFHDHLNPRFRGSVKVQ
ncbi:MAG: Uncharacterized protein G01um101429_947 [Parcubacteria group bacterium Gr01-1014_29]|nr:MAG: Uncharacterized protein G01um101429_947 [Parcubacteria group bacterium Gr01-1014_29]